MTAQIAIDQDRPGPSTSYGTPGQARDDLWLGHTIHPRSVATAGTYAWVLLDKPPGSTAVVSNASSQTCALTPDEAGSYRLELSVDGGGLGNVVRIIAACTLDSAGDLVHHGWRIPAVGELPEESNFSGTNTRGWDEALRNIFDYLDTVGSVQYEDVFVGQRRTLNFIGAGFSVVDNPGNDSIDVTSAGLTLKDEGVSLGPFSSIDAVGAGVQITDLGGGAARLSVPGLTVKDEGVSLGALASMDFVGDGVTVTNVAGVAHVAIPGLTVEDEGISLGPFAYMNFTGDGVTVTDVSGVATVAVPGLTVKDEGVSLGPFPYMNFVGVGVTASNAGGGVAQVSVPGLDVKNNATDLGYFKSLKFTGSLVASDLGGNDAQVTGGTPVGAIIPFVDGVFNTNSSFAIRAGGRFLDLTPWPATIGTLTRTVKFVANIESSFSGATAHVQLQNVTDNETVTGTNLTTSNLSNTEVSATVTVGSSSGNLKTSKTYEVQVYLSGGGATDRVTITNARLLITYA